MKSNERTSIPGSAPSRRPVGAVLLAALAALFGALLAPIAPREALARADPSELDRRIAALENGAYASSDLDDVSPTADIVEAAKAAGGRDFAAKKQRYWSEGPDGLFGRYYALSFRGPCESFLAALRTAESPARLRVLCEASFTRASGAQAKDGTAEISFIAFAVDRKGCVAALLEAEEHGGYDRRRSIAAIERFEAAIAERTRFSEALELPEPAGTMLFHTRAAGAFAEKNPNQLFLKFRSKKREVEAVPSYVRGLVERLLWAGGPTPEVKAFNEREGEWLGVIWITIKRGGGK